MTVSINVDEVAVRYLESKSSTLWGRGFDLSQPESKNEAVQFLAAEFMGLMELVNATAAEARALSESGQAPAPAPPDDTADSEGW